MKLRKLASITGLALSLSLCAPFAAYAVNAEEEAPIFADDFEGENISGWGVLGGSGTMVLDTENKQSGNSSLSVSERKQPFNGPSITLDKYIEAEETYRFSGWVFNASPEAASINCTLRFSDSVNVDSYTGITTIEAEPSVWTYFEGSVDTPEDLASTLLYFECENTAVNFNIDDIRVYGKTPEAPVNLEGPADKKEAVDKYSFDFESGFNEWISRGDTRLIRTDEQQNSGNYSLLSTNRNKVWNGPSVPIDGILRETEYTYEGSILYTDKKADDVHEFLLEVQYSFNGNENYVNIARTDVNKNEWTKLKGTYSVPAGATNVTLYLQTTNPDEESNPAELTHTDLVSFYVDDISVTRSDLVGKKDFSKIFESIGINGLLLIIAGIVILVVLIVVIARLRSSDSEETEASAAESEGVQDVLDTLDGKNEKAEENSSEDTADSKPEKADEQKEEKSSESSDSEKEPETKQESKKEKKKNKSSAEDSRSKEVFGIETFSYDDPDAATATDNTEGGSVENPDSPFDGF